MTDDKLAEAAWEKLPDRHHNDLHDILPETVWCDGYDAGRASLEAEVERLKGQVETLAHVATHNQSVYTRLEEQLRLADRLADRMSVMEADHSLKYPLDILIRDSKVVSQALAAYLQARTPPEAKP